jgi:hypothetical protein
VVTVGGHYAATNLALRISIAVALAGDSVDAIDSIRNLMSESMLVKTSGY